MCVCVIDVQIACSVRPDRKGQRATRVCLCVVEECLIPATTVERRSACRDPKEAMDSRGRQCEEEKSRVFGGGGGQKKESGLE